MRGEGGKLTIEELAPIDEKCPVCQNDLMWRRGRVGPFIACSNYPTCTYIKKKEAREIGLLCPDCGVGQVVERKGRSGRFFYGCRRYPECRFTAYHRPIPEACPDCGRPYLLEKETKKEGKVVSAATRAKARGRRGVAGVIRSSRSRPGPRVRCRHPERKGWRARREG